MLRSLIKTGVAVGITSFSFISPLPATAAGGENACEGEKKVDLQIVNKETPAYSGKVYICIEEDQNPWEEIPKYFQQVDEIEKESETFTIEGQGFCTEEKKGDSCVW